MPSATTCNKRGTAFLNKTLFNALICVCWSLLWLFTADLSCAAASPQAFVAFASSSDNSLINEEGVWEFSQKPLLHLIACNKLLEYALKSVAFGLIIGALTAAANIHCASFSPFMLCCVLCTIFCSSCCFAFLVGGVGWALGGASFGEFHAISNILSFSAVNQMLVFGWLALYLSICNISMLYHSQLQMHESTSAHNNSHDATRITSSPIRIHPKQLSILKV